MVKSLLDSSINYKDLKEVDDNDLDFDAQLFESYFNDVKIIFAIGNPDYKYKDKNIVFFHIYMIENDVLTNQIGVYEMLLNEIDTFFDEDHNYDLNKFNEPLLYSFSDLLLEKYNQTDEPIEPDSIKPKTKKTTKKTKWIKSYLDDDNYSLIDTKYDGNCFFSVLEIALNDNGQEISIDGMREILSENADQALFDNYKEIYDSITMQYENETREIKNLTKRYNALMKTIKETKDRSIQKNYIAQGIEIKKQHNTLKQERNNTKNILFELDFMEGIDSLPMLKLQIKTNKFWADTWAISTLERELNLKTIIFSENNYQEGDIINVLQCGQLNDTILEDNGIFEPSFYVLVAYHGLSHYQLISYNNNNSFSFEDLPEQIKNLVSEKCLEKIAGPYSLIPEFINYNLKSKETTIISDSDKSTDSTIADMNKDIVHEMHEKDDFVSDLFDKSTVFRFYSKSTDKPLPGHGAGEKIGSEGDHAYKELSKIPQWRKKLSNFWQSEFTLDGHRWLSVEHYYQAAKFKKNNKEFYIQFSLDSPDSSIAKDPLLAKAAGGKTGKFKGENLRPKEIKADPSFFKQNPTNSDSIEMERAMRSKFTQNDELKQLLIATKNAKLEHITRGKPAIVFNNLMRIRRELRDLK